MIISTINRFELINLLPKGGTVAEIGVFNGELSKAILEICKPIKLYLIDSWGPMETKKFDFDPAYQTMNEADITYQNLLNKFKKEIKSGQVEVIRSLSSIAAKTFPDNFFDWVYIDADHTYEGALIDLKSYNTKVKENGFILGHDYTNQSIALSWSFGVIEAVNEFIKENNYQFLIATLREGFPTYVISKVYGNEADNLLQSLVYSSPFSLEVKDFMNFKCYHNILNNGAVLVKLEGLK
jgi:hypothetical protein